MAQQGRIRNINGIPHTYVNGKWVAVGEMGATGGGLSGSYVGSGQSGAIGGILGVTGPTDSPSGKAAIDRLTNQADRRDCNVAGGFYTLGGECLKGEEVYSYGVVASLLEEIGCYRSVAELLRGFANE